MVIVTGVGRRRPSRNGFCPRSPAAAASQISRRISSSLHTRVGARSVTLRGRPAAARAAFQLPKTIRTRAGEGHVARGRVAKVTERWGVPDDASKLLQNGNDARRRPHPHRATSPGPATSRPRTRRALVQSRYQARPLCSVPLRRRLRPPDMPH